MLPSRRAAFAGLALLLSACAGLVGADFEDLSRSGPANVSPTEPEGIEAGAVEDDPLPPSSPSKDGGPSADSAPAGEPVTCFRDEDGDGFGSDAGKTFIDKCPAGYTPKPGDCDDKSFAANPAQTDSFLEPHDGSFDYNCDGKLTATLKMPSKPNTPFGTTCTAFTNISTCVNAVILPPLECGLKGSSTSACAWQNGRTPPCFGAVASAVDYEVVCR